MRRPKQDLAAARRTFTRRALLLSTAQLGLAGGLTLRLRAMQGEDAETYLLLAEENRVKIELLPPARGLIFDRNGVSLAENEQNYRVTMTRADARDVAQTLHNLRQLIPLTEDDVTHAAELLETRSAFVPITIADRLGWDDIARVTANAPALPGISAEVGLSRVYPQGPTMAHVVGYVGPVSSYDLTRGYLATDDDPLLQIPRFQVGKSGVEAQREHVLRGRAGTKRVEVNARGRVMRELTREEGVSGEDLQLTIDTALQAYIHARLDGQSASVVVIDLENGDLRAIASAPGFDPNLFVRGISVPDYNALLERDLEPADQRRPLASKAVQDGYPPGSTFKMITALAALESGDIMPDETVYCPGHLEVADVKFHCWKRSGHGNVDLHESLKQSCDVYYYDICQRVGIDKIAEMARLLGIGVKHDVPLSAVTTGIAPDKAWKLRTRAEDWRIGDTVNAAIGQGYVLASPLQLAVMSARIASGRSITPRLVQRVSGRATESGAGEALPLNENNLRRIRAAMFDVVNHRRGTAFRSRIADENMQMAGKTGTSQVRRITAEERAAGVTRNEDLPWNRRDHALFVGFAPAHAPRYAISVVVEHGGGGSSAAAPIARDVMLQTLYGGLPPLSAYPAAIRSHVRGEQERISAALREATTP